MEHMEIKILQPIFGILVVLMKNKLTKICDEPGKNQEERLKVRFRHFFGYLFESWCMSNQKN